MATIDVSAPPASDRPPQGPVRRLSGALYRHPRLRLVATLGGPLAWMALVYLVSLILLLANSFYRLNPLTSQVVKEFTLKNYKTVFGPFTHVWAIVVFLLIAIAVTIAAGVAHRRTTSAEEGGGERVARKTWLVVALSGPVVVVTWLVFTVVLLNSVDGSPAKFAGISWPNVYYAITARTLTMAILVTATDLAIAFPFAYYAVRIAKANARTRLLLAVTIPLWANYLIKVFAWKTLLEGGGPIHSLLQTFGIDLTGSSTAVWLTFTYIWLPYAVLPIAAALERVPDSYLEASGDLGARAWTTFRRVIFPLAVPGIVAGSIFTFSLTLGDYLTTQLVGKSLFLGNTIAQLTGVANNKPLAATIAVIPIGIVAIYLTIARKTGAFEAL